MIYIYVVVITVESKGKASVFCLKLHADENNGSIKWLLPSPLRAIHENLVLRNELIKIESLP